MGDTRLPHQGGIPGRSWIPPTIKKTSGNASDSDSGLEPELVGKSDAESDGFSADAEAEEEAKAQPQAVAA